MHALNGLGAAWQKVISMARSGSEKRQRNIVLKARFNEREAQLLREHAQRAGLSVAAYIRLATLNLKPPRARRQPPLNQKQAAQLMYQLGQVRAGLREVQLVGSGARSDFLIEAMQRDLADMRVALFEAVGRKP